MWRSNVLRSRSCSSAVHFGCRHGRKLRWYSSAASTPVSEEEFLSAFERLAPRRMWKPHQTFGFAISGGVDSMALAALYSKAQQTNNLPKGHAFIVDHKLRPESTEEAEWVAQQLSSKPGMEATILPLTWPTDLDLLDYHRFETSARTLRYRALGLACRAKKIKSLLIAHHADDQAETVMMRLQMLRWRTGLQGMQGLEWIPECYGIHGVHHSHSTSSYKNRNHDKGLPYPVEQGGIQILRPLLGFEKSRLIKTCEEEGIAWAEDKTNHIQTVTARNAIRHIFKHHKLPAALDIKALVAVSEKMQKRIESHKAYAENLFNNSPMKLDIQTGSLIIRFPAHIALLNRPILTESDRNEARNNAYYLLERVAELVSPREKPPIGQLSNAINAIYPSLDPNSNILEDSKPTTSKKNFCVFGIWWRPWDQPTPFHDPGSITIERKHEMDWLLSRQPLEDGERNKPQTQIIFSPNPSAVALNTDTTPTAQPTEQWHLFDGRFWIRLQNHTQSELVLRTLEDSDLLHLPSTRKKVRRNIARQENPDTQPDRYIRTALTLIKPSSLRRHLPAVFLKQDDGEEKLIGLPTLNVSLDTTGSNPNLCTWEVRYKKISPGRRQLRDIIVPGVRHDWIVGVEKDTRNQTPNITGHYKNYHSRSVKGGHDGSTRSKNPKKTRREKWIRDEHEEEGLGEWMKGKASTSAKSYKLFEDPNQDGRVKKQQQQQQQQQQRERKWPDYVDRI